MWLEEEGCREIVEEAWSLETNGHAMVRVEGKIGHCQSRLKWLRGGYWEHYSAIKGKKKKNSYKRQKMQQ